jgi:predicted site-specific integrase-resolvase
MKILLSKWAQQHFDPAPSIATLRQWAKTGQITPLPVKVGRAWMVDEDAEYTPLQVSGHGISKRAQAILDDTKAA